MILVEQQSDPSSRVSIPSIWYPQLPFRKHDIAFPLEMWEILSYVHQAETKAYDTKGVWRGAPIRKHHVALSYIESINEAFHATLIFTAFFAHDRQLGFVVVLVSKQRLRELKILLLRDIDFFVSYDDCNLISIWCHSRHYGLRPKVCDLVLQY